MNLFYWNISYRYKYGAKELATELGLNAYDFEARMQSPALPMFAQMLEKLIVTANSAGML